MRLLWFLLAQEGLRSRAEGLQFLFRFGCERRLSRNTFHAWQSLHGLERVAKTLVRAARKEEVMGTAARSLRFGVQQQTSRGEFKT